MDDPLLTAVAGALRQQGISDPKAVLAAADAAERVLGRDRCVCRQSVHLQHHRSPVDGCSWCHPATVPKARTRGSDTVPTGGML